MMKVALGFSNCKHSVNFGGVVQWNHNFIVDEELKKNIGFEFERKNVIWMKEGTDMVYDFGKNVES